MTFILDLLHLPAVAAAVFVALCATTAYLYQRIQDRRGNLKEALYLLLEIWHRITLLANESSIDLLLNRIFEGVKQRLPQLRFDDAEVKAAAGNAKPVLQNLIRSRALEGFENVQDAYAQVIKLISKSDPIFAYRLESAMSIKQRLALLDTALKDAMPLTLDQPPVVAALAASVTDRLRTTANTDSMQELEAALRSLTWRISLWSYFLVRREIKKRAKQLATPDSEIFNLVDNMLVPALVEAVASTSKVTAQVAK